MPRSAVRCFQMVSHVSKSLVCRNGASWNNTQTKGEEHSFWVGFSGCWRETMKASRGRSQESSRGKLQGKAIWKTLEDAENHGSTWSGKTRDTGHWKQLTVASVVQKWSNEMFADTEWNDRKIEALESSRGSRTSWVVNLRVTMSDVLWECWSILGPRSWVAIISDFSLLMPLSLIMTEELATPWHRTHLFVHSVLCSKEKPPPQIFFVFIHCENVGA